ncbi:MAG: hypothetical protein WCO60_09160 [Verrucomicrobiota bacterium]
MSDVTQQLVAALRTRLATISDREWYHRDAEGHLQALQSVSQDIIGLAAQLPQPVDPQLAHYFQRCSYDKALAFLEAQACQ